MTGNTVIYSLEFNYLFIYGGALEQLTTPKLKEEDVVLPGENWFFYWKTSPSLWEAKLREYSGPGPLFVPIYWALHSEYSDQFDFGQNKPETDLKKLYECARNVGKELVFFIPVGPVPFLINGGVPSFLARNVSLNQEELAISVIDNKDRVNRIYSFYNPKVFQAYRKFAWHVGQYFSQLGIDCSIHGLSACRLEDDHIVSYFKDHSTVFDGGFSRYISQIKDTHPDKIERLKVDPSYVKDLKEEYSVLIRKLYLDAAKECLAGHWSGEFRVCLLGGGTKDIFKRSMDSWESDRDYFNPLLKSIVNQVYPCSVLLSHELKKGSLGKALKDIVTSGFVQKHLNKGLYEDDLSLSFQPLVFFELLDEGDGHFSFENMMDKSGLKYYFDKEFPWSYKVSREFPVEIEELNSRSIYFFFGSRLDKNSFNKILKLFMNGIKVFIDTDELDQKLIDKLDVFLIENQIETEKINYITPITKASLGEGLVITYDSKKLQETSLIKRAGFWDKMVNYLDIKQLKVNTDDEVEYFWTARSSNTYELNFEEVRRVSLYNPTSYKRKAHINTSSNFAFIKSLDLINSEVKSTPIGIDIQLLPGASVTLDFGFFEL